MTQTNQNKDHSWQWLDELLQHVQNSGYAIAADWHDSEDAKTSRDSAKAAIIAKIDEHYIGKGEAELKVQEERDRWVTASMKRLARFDETKIPPDVQAYIEQRCIEARREGYDLALDQLYEWAELWNGNHRSEFNYYGAIKSLKVSKDMRLPFVQLSTNNKDTLERSE